MSASDMRGRKSRMSLRSSGLQCYPPAPLDRRRACCSISFLKTRQDPDPRVIRETGRSLSAAEERSPHERQRYAGPEVPDVAALIRATVLSASASGSAKSFHIQLSSSRACAGRYVQVPSPLVGEG
jgi:hypothetical protein